MEVEREESVGYLNIDRNYEVLQNLKMRTSLLTLTVLSLSLLLASSTIIITRSTPRVFQLSKNKMAIVFDQNDDTLQDNLEKAQTQTQPQPQQKPQSSAPEAPEQSQVQSQPQRAEPQVETPSYSPAVQTQSEQSNQGSQTKSPYIAMVTHSAQMAHQSTNAQALHHQTQVTTTGGDKTQTHTQTTKYGSLSASATGMKYQTAGVYGLPNTFDSSNHPTQQLTQEPSQEEISEEPFRPVSPSAQTVEHHFEQESESSEQQTPTKPTNPQPLPVSPTNEQQQVPESTVPTSDPSALDSKIGSGAPPAPVPTPTKPQETSNLPIPTSGGESALGSKIGSGAPPGPSPAPAPVPEEEIPFGIGLPNPNVQTSSAPRNLAIMHVASEQ